MNEIEKILNVVNIYCRETGLSMARVSTVVFNDGKKVRRLVEGADLGTRTHARAMQWFSDNWPKNADWPDGVSRPKITEPAQ